MRQVFTSKSGVARSGLGLLKLRLSWLLLAAVMGSASAEAAYASSADKASEATVQQNNQVRGKVTSAADGSPIIGATVTLKNNSSVGTVTDAEGNFTLNVPRGSVLEVSYLGYTPQDVVVGPGIVAVALKEDALAVEDVVVTAMGIKKEKKALGYAVQDIKSDELLKNKDANIINSLNGKIAGVNITSQGGAPGASASIIIRGGTSLERDNQPLFVIDGMPIDNSTSLGGDSAFDGTTNIGTTSSNRAMDINPEDVESISVLKGPAAAALYGLRAAAGAIVITTKKGKEGQVNVSFSTKYSNSWVNRLPKQQKRYKQGSYYSGKFDGVNTYSWGDPFQAGEPQYDNMDDFFEHAHAWDNNVSVSAGNKHGSFYLSASRLDQTGVVPETDYKKNTFRFNGEQKYGRFTFGANVAYSTSQSRKTLTGSGLWSGGGTGYMESIIRWPRSDNMANWLDEYGARRPLLPSLKLEDQIDNPYWLVNKNPTKDKNKRFIGSIYAGFELNDWLNINYKLGLDSYQTDYQNLITPGSAVKLAWQDGMLSQHVKNYDYINSNLMVTLHKTLWKDWDFTLLLGQSVDDTKQRTNSMRIEGFEMDILSMNNATHENQYLSQSHAHRRLVGVYGDFRVAYKNIAYVSVTGRNDWTSTLPDKNRSFFYPSVSGSFVFTELLPRNNVLTFGKLRASWAQVGKDAPAYQTLTYLFGPETTIGDGFRDSWTRGNPELKPETTTSWEVGAELRFFGGRLGVDATYYNIESKDQILQPRVSNATGYILSYMNTGLIKNKGFELSLTGTPVQTKNFSWDMTLNLSSNKGTVEDLPKGMEILYVTDVQVGNAKAASFSGGKFMGLSGSRWQTDENGNLKLDWKTGYPLTTTNQTDYVGNREPKLIGGFNNSLQYKGWNLSFLFDFRVGGDVYNGTEYMLTYYGLSERTLNREGQTTFRGVSQNPNTKQWETVERTVKTDEKFYRDIYTKHAPYFIEDVNWFRLRSLSLSYAFPQEWLQRTRVIKGLTITVSGNNLLLATNYKGMDPEANAAGAGVIGSGSAGIDYCGVPATAGMSFGININF